ncbi:hypothetical protein HDU82_004254 [Entophlyctis luteolus]|nr:hypothetical protein HDU82_004254 [Entophlyctis luteolus]
MYHLQVAQLQRLQLQQLEYIQCQLDLCAERQGRANLAAIASSLTLHMADSAASMAAPARLRTLTPPSSPRNPPAPSRYAPYPQQPLNNSSSSSARHAKSTNPAPTRATAKYATKAAPKHAVMSPAPSPRPPRAAAARTHDALAPAPSLAESQQIQQIVLVALTTLKLPPHAVVLALYFVHKLLIATVRRAAARCSTNASSPPPVSAAAEMQWSPVHMFVAGLMLADAVLCDAPVAVAAWAWILSQSSASTAADSRTARDLRRWALDILEFDVNVKPPVYAAWARNVNLFLKSRGVFGLDECMLAL